MPYSVTMTGASSGGDITGQAIDDRPYTLTQHRHLETILSSYGLNKQPP
jgi:hypothetical protein